uniref:Phospholipase A2 n=1 Tax=Ascaris suum TaxID=6253 RepID=F1LFX1_ASCSU
MFISQIILLALLNQIFANHPYNKALWNMDGMSQCILHYTGLYYNMYGCFCGMGGSGYAVDGIDACCMYHDNCYDDAFKKGNCSTIELYTKNYKWECIDGMIICTRGQGSCEQALCDCDKRLFNCLAHFPKPTVKASCPI